jgi:hypothetical protein
VVKKHNLVYVRIACDLGSSVSAACIFTRLSELRLSESVPDNCSEVMKWKGGWGLIWNSSLGSTVSHSTFYTNKILFSL